MNSDAKPPSNKQSETQITSNEEGIGNDDQKNQLPF